MKSTNDWYTKNNKTHFVTDIEYKRLGKETLPRGSKSTGSKNKRGLWFIPSIRHTKTLESIKSKVITKGKNNARIVKKFSMNGIVFKGFIL